MLRNTYVACLVSYYSIRTWITRINLLSQKKKAMVRVLRNFPFQQPLQNIKTFYDHVTCYGLFWNCPKKDEVSAVLHVRMCCCLSYFMIRIQLSFSFRHNICWSAVKFVSSLYCKGCKKFRSFGQSNCYKGFVKLHSSISLLSIFKYHSTKACTLQWNVITFQVVNWTPSTPWKHGQVEV
jgi:hypothetical protein